MSSQTQKPKQEFCCWHWKQLIELGNIKTKEQEFKGREHFKNDPKFYDIHPNFIMWVEDPNDLMKSGYHWYHYCPNCGKQKDSDENIKAWSGYWNNNTMPK